MHLVFCGRVPFAIYQRDFMFPEIIMIVIVCDCKKIIQTLNILVSYSYWLTIRMVREMLFKIKGFMCSKCDLINKKSKRKKRKRRKTKRGVGSNRFYLFSLICYFNFP